MRWRTAVVQCSDFKHSCLCSINMQCVYCIYRYKCVALVWAMSHFWGRGEACLHYRMCLYEGFACFGSQQHNLYKCFSNMHISVKSIQTVKRELHSLIVGICSDWSRLSYYVTVTVASWVEYKWFLINALSATCSAGVKQAPNDAASLPVSLRALPSAGVNPIADLINRARARWIARRW